MVDTLVQGSPTLFCPYKMGKFDLSHRLVSCSLPNSINQPFFLYVIFFWFVNFGMLLLQGGAGSNDEMQSIEFDSAGGSCFVLLPKGNPWWITHHRRNLHLQHLCRVRHNYLSLSSNLTSSQLSSLNLVGCFVFLNLNLYQTCQ